MSETAKEWLTGLYEFAIKETQGTISNNHLWELGYDGEEPNPYTQNIQDLEEYLEILREKLEELDKSTKTEEPTRTQETHQYSWSLDDNDTLTIWQDNKTLATISNVTSKEQAERLFDETLYDLLGVI